ncbi:MAG: DUF1573 domain-containing protein [Cytophagales bacterium]
MKHILIAAAIAISMLSCDKKTKETVQKTDTVTLGTGEGSNGRFLFEETTYDFGKIKQGDIVKHTFKFKNDGENPLIISGAQASCGCTVPEYAKEPIAPGAESQILVQFNSTGKIGTQNKTITITANTLPNTTTLVLKGLVEAKPVVDSTLSSKK